MKLLSSKCMVIKIGSSLLVDENSQCINSTWLASLIDDVAQLIKQNIAVILVSSGAVAFGKLSLGFANKSISLDGKQAASAVGQIQLMQAYHSLFNQKGIETAQVLLTLDDTEDRKRFINCRNTFKKLLELNVVPIVNENDSVATAEIRYGDNDRLSARVAQMVDADTLVLLSDIDGFYTDNPHTAKDATLIPTVEKLTPDIVAMAKNSSTNYGSGGMVSKLEAAKIAMNSGCRMLITSGKPSHPITTYLTANKGTWFQPKGSQQRMKKKWLQEHLKPTGSLIIENGAVLALKKGASLLPVGIISMSGQFQKGEVVRLITESNEEIARGLVNYAYYELNKIRGKKTSEIKSILSQDCCHEAIHRDNLAIIESKHHE